jgi:hypothetical protein
MPALASCGLYPSNRSSYSEECAGRPMLRDGVLHQDATELTCAVPQSYKPETHNLHILKPYYYSEPKETYKDVEPLIFHCNIFLKRYP